MSKEAVQFLEELQKQDYEAYKLPHWLRREKGVLINAKLSELLEQLNVAKASIASSNDDLDSLKYIFPNQSGLDKLPAHQREALLDSRFTDKLDSLLKAPLPTKLESPFMYSIFLLIFPFLQRGFKRFGYTSEDITVGTRPHPEVNAQVFRMPNGLGHLIAVQEGLIAFLYKASQIFNKYSTHPDHFFDKWTLREDIQSRDDIDLQSKIKLDAATDFIQILYVFLFGGSDEYDQFNFRSKDASTNMSIGISTINPMFTFLFAHEYAHIFLDHQLGEKDWQKETEADLKALQIVLAAFKQEELVYPLLSAIFLYFELIEILEATKSIMVTGKPYQIRSDSHPYPKIRKVTLYQTINEYLKINPQDHQMTKIGMVGTSNFGMELLFRIKPQIENWKSSGLQMKSFLNLQNIGSL